MIQIEEMQREHIGQVIDIYRQYVNEGKSTFNTTCPSEEEWDKGHCKDCRYVVTESGKVVGWAAIIPTSSRVVYKGVVDLSIYIDMEHRRMGLGDMLMERVCRETEEHGYWCIVSSIFAINTPSLGIHRKYGFREVGYREKISKDRFGIWQDTILMERRNSIR